MKTMNYAGSVCLISIVMFFGCNGYPVKATKWVKHMPDGHMRSIVNLYDRHQPWGDDVIKTVINGC